MNADNSGVPDLDPKLPETFSDAERGFKRFLASQNYPDSICWLTPGDLVIAQNRHYWARKRGAKQSEIAALQYRFGVQRNLGILLEAVCATETETFARVFIPEDDIDAQYRLIGRGLKLSCPVERYRMSAVTNPVHWLFLRLRYRKTKQDA